MTPKEIQTKQLERWSDLLITYIDDINSIDSKKINKQEIITIAQKIQDLENILNGKSKIIGWR